MALASGQRRNDSAPPEADPAHYDALRPVIFWAVVN